MQRQFVLATYEPNNSSTGESTSFEQHRASCALLTLEVSTIAVMHRTENQAIAEGGLSKRGKLGLASTDHRTV